MTFSVNCRKRCPLSDSNLYFRGENQIPMSNIDDSCSLMKLDGGFSRLHSADDDAGKSWKANQHTKGDKYMTEVLDSCPFLTPSITFVAYGRIHTQTSRCKYKFKPLLPLQYSHKMQTHYIYLRLVCSRFEDVSVSFFSGSEINYNESHQTDRIDINNKQNFNTHCLQMPHDMSKAYQVYQEY